MITFWCKEALSFGEQQDTVVLCDSLDIVQTITVCKKSSCSNRMPLLIEAVTDTISVACIHTCGYTFGNLSTRLPAYDK